MSHGLSLSFDGVNNTDNQPIGKASKSSSACGRKKEKDVGDQSCVSPVPSIKKRRTRSPIRFRKDSPLCKIDGRNISDWLAKSSEFVHACGTDQSAVSPKQGKQDKMDAYQSPIVPRRVAQTPDPAEQVVPSIPKELDAVMTGIKRLPKTPATALDLTTKSATLGAAPIDEVPSITDPDQYAVAPSITKPCDINDPFKVEPNDIDNAPSTSHPARSDDAPSITDPDQSADAPSITEPCDINDSIKVEPNDIDNAPSTSHPGRSDDAPSIPKPGLSKDAPSITKLDRSEDALSITEHGQSDDEFPTAEPDGTIEDGRLAQLITLEKLKAINKMLDNFK
ncbi:unnamed protein product [Owenia fusiformis]|uniref:Uncharacterized protein n=1 Tax=Owenia fusiformis TaxID=6347 RepID=A0A8S4PYN0_OWEFU|nr:unnamed protein product [Owenia fusiformis]